MVTKSKAATTRRAAWRRLFPPDAAAPLAALSPAALADARRAADLILAAHRAYLADFNDLTAKAKETFETRAWTQGSLDAGRRVQLYRDAVNGTWRKLGRLFGEQAAQREFWMGARQAYLESVFDEYEADIALTFLYSTMRLAFDAQDTPVEYADDGLAEQSDMRSPRQVWRVYPAAPQQLIASVAEVLRGCNF
ncbi:MAG: isocitrate dehydrogenase kinase/phosphatase AceK regulatory subunit, partial [Bryobacteraceae bacterium]